MSDTSDALGIGGSLLGQTTVDDTSIEGLIKSVDDATKQAEPAQWQPIASTNLAAVKYDPVTATLGIRFHSGGTYSYRQVPSDIYDGLISAPSAGHYFVHNIKHVYAFNRGG